MGLPQVDVNGRPLDLAGTPVHTNALDWLRSHGLTGAKEGCAEGECGACAVLVSRPTPLRPDAHGTSEPTREPAREPARDQTEWVAVNACLLPAATLAGQEVITAEGLGSPDRLHPVQRALAEAGGSQCGYCTPGFVCSMAAEYYRPGRATGWQDDGFDLDALSGNLCRCTGYRPIRDAALSLEAPSADDPVAARCAEPPRPVGAVRLADDTGELVRPATLSEAVDLLAAHPDTVVVAGSTDVGVELNLRGLRPRRLVAIDRLAELRELRVEDDHVWIGAALTLTEIERGLGDRVPLLSALWPRFASRLIRNSATLGGNLATASPIGDAAPVLLALDASVVLAGPDGDRTVALSDFFTGYRRTGRYAAELVRAVTVPLPLIPLTGLHKVAKRHVDDISGVMVALALRVEDDVVTRARIGLGGVAEIPIRARVTEDALVGRPWTEATARDVGRVLAAEGTPIDDVRASAAYRRAVLGGSLLRLLVETTGLPGPEAGNGQVVVA